MEVGRGVEDEAEQGDEAEAGSHQIGVGERAVLPYDAAQHQADADAYIPGSKIGRGGRAALVVAAEVDEHGVEGREHGSESGSEHKCSGIEHQGSGMNRYRRHPLAEEQTQEAYNHRIKGGVYHFGNVPVIHLLSREESGYRQAD